MDVDNSSQQKNEEKDEKQQLLSTYIACRGVARVVEKGNVTKVLYRVCQ